MNKSFSPWTASLAIFGDTNQCTEISADDSTFPMTKVYDLKNVSNIIAFRSDNQAKEFCLVDSLVSSGNSLQEQCGCESRGR